MEEEINSMKSNKIGELVDLPLCHKMIEIKWVLNNKQKVDGTIDRYNV